MSSQLRDTASLRFYPDHQSPQKEPVERKIRGGAVDGNETHSVHNRIALHRLEGYAHHRFRVEAANNHKKEAEAAHKTAKRLHVIQTRIIHEEEGKITVREEMVHKENEHEQRTP